MNRGLLAVIVCLNLAACRQAASTLFDLPPEAQVKSRDTVIVSGPRATTGGRLVIDTVRPPIEHTLDADSVVAMLPRDHAGNIDWMAALRRGIIKPRSAIPTDSGTPGEPPFQFRFDFYLPGPDSMFDAYFPHSSHTQWLDCKQCHGRIFRYRGTRIKMVDLFQGRYCAECHGKVSYPVATGCERCHVNLQMPADRAPADLIGNVQLARVTTDSAIAASDSIGNAGGVWTGSLPRATFPHWVHRIRFRCKVCHNSIFEPKAGANRILMKDIAAGQACGKCHNGKVAFRAGFGTCERCHVPTGPENDTR